MLITKSVVGFPGYLITNTGKVYSLPKASRLGTRLMVGELDKYGYHIVTLTMNGKQYTKKVHRLVAEAFLPNPLRKPQVNHLDENKSNNRTTNLEWVTPRENVLHSIPGRYRDSKWHNAKLHPADIPDIIKFCDSKLVTKKAIARVYNVSESLIEKIYYRKAWTRVACEKKP